MNKQPTTEQLRKYVAGQLSRAEQYVVERAALNDPFVADALDGLMMSENTTDNLVELKKRLQKRVSPTQTQRLGIWFWASAAAAVVGVGLGWVYFKIEKNTEPTLTMAAPTAEEKTLQIEVIKPKKEELLAAIDKPKPQTATLYDNASTDEEIIVAADEDQIKAEIAPTTEEVETVSITMTKAAPVSSVGSFSKTDSVLLATQITARGVIRAADGSVLPGVSVNVEGSGRGVSTDVNGAFLLDKIKMGDRLAFSYVGFDKKEIVIKDSTTQQIVLEEDGRLLYEVVVKSYGRKAKKIIKKAARKAKRKQKKP